jgi:predicted phosphodiesterase
MRIAILSDIHGNLEAFEEVLKDIRKEGISHVYSLGDNVGYGPDPEKVMVRVREENILSVMGNHEMAMKYEPFLSWFNPMAQKAILFTKAHLSEDSLRDIGEYPRFRTFEDLRFFHGAPPSSPFLYLFQLDDVRLSRRLDRLGQSICFAGHTHDLQIVEYTGEAIDRRTLSLGETLLNPESRYVINVGSVGQPRDRDKRAKYAIFETTEKKLEIRAVEYDAGLTAKKILDAGLPEQYASKLL